jgi:Uma2 family endonuclease
MENVITNINRLDFNNLYSYDDYYKWQFNDRVELIKGKIHKMSTTTYSRHQELVWNFSMQIDKYLRNKPCKAYFAPFDVCLPRTKDDNVSPKITVLQPDICIVYDLSKLDEKGCDGAPDLVIEILSPGNSDKEMKLKYDVYKESGVKEYWIVQPEYQNVLVYALDDSGKFIGKHPITASDFLTSTIFPDFTIDLSEAFAE